jgi:hypothetical protein
MTQDKEQHTPTSADEALYAQLLSVQVVRAIQQAYADGKMDLETYNKLYEVARNADGQVRKCVDLLEEEKRIKQMAETFKKAAHDHP